EMGQIDETLAEQIGERARLRLKEALDEVKRDGFCPVPATLGGVWQDYVGGPEKDVPDVDTRVDRETILKLSETLATTPRSFVLHPKIKTLLAQRHRRVSRG